MKKLTIILGMWAVLFLAGTALAGSQATSGKTVQNIIDEARSEVNDNSSIFVSDANMLEWTHNASVAITALARCLEFTETLTLLTETMGYTLTTAHYDIETVYIDSGISDSKDRFVPLEKVDPGSIYGRPKTSGIPSCWFQWNERINVWPIPSSEANNYTLVVCGIAATPARLTAVTDPIQTPYYFDTAYVDYLQAKYWEKDKKYDKMAYFMNRFENAIIRYRMEVRRPLVYVEGK